MKAKELIEQYKSGVRDFRQVDLEGENLAWSTLTDADFRGANLQHVNFKGATLHRVKFNEGASLAFTDLSSAELINADLRGANLQGANLSETQLNVIVDEHTRLPKGFKARLQPEHRSEPLDYKKQIEQLTQENFELQEKLEGKQQHTKPAITQLQKKICDSENSKKQYKQDQVSTQILVQENNYLRHQQVKIKSILTERDYQIKKITQEKLELQERLDKERKQSKFFITQSEQKTYDLKRLVQNLEDQSKRDQQSIRALITESDRLKQSLQAVLDKKQQLSDSPQTTESHAKSQQQQLVQDKRKKYSHRGKRQQRHEISGKAHE